MKKRTLAAVVFALIVLAGCAQVGAGPAEENTRPQTAADLDSPEAAAAPAAAPPIAPPIAPSIVPPIAPPVVPPPVSRTDEAASAPVSEQAATPQAAPGNAGTANERPAPPANIAASAAGEAQATGHTPARAPAAPASPADIGEAKAKAIALAHAGLREADVVFVRVHLDYDDGRREYEVEFYSGNVEYDYDIDAASGEIRSFDLDAEYHAPTQTAPPPAPANPADIGEAKAKEIALNHAGYTADGVRRLRAERDYDDGRFEYEVEFYVGNIEYSY
ncbi:MAG: PepSY domain-containing protein, partial [Oscillospiraceae bacterium]|nr:PepSY domain-containing protein [Oscillospiraceae bacterium]